MSFKYLLRSGPCLTEAVDMKITVKPGLLLFGGRSGACLKLIFIDFGNFGILERDFASAYFVFKNNGPFSFGVNFLGIIGFI